jgi:hypothetical protein
MWSCTACVAAALLIGIAPAHADEAAEAPAEALPAVPVNALPEAPKALPEAPPAASPEAPIEAAKLDVEPYQLEVNTPGVTLGTVEPAGPDDVDVDFASNFASNFYLDLESRRANLRLAGFDNELALDWDMRARNLKLRLAGGHMGTFFIAIDGDITLRRKPTIDARLILAVGGQKLELDLPKFRVDARLREGDLQMEFVVPLIDGGF